MLLAPVEEVFLALLVLVEESVYLVFVASKDVTALTVELGFDVGEFGTVVFAHGHELVLHLGDECVDVLGHLRDRLHVVLVFLVYLRLELFDQLSFVGDDLITGSLLRLDVISKLFTVFFFFKLLPVPVNLHVLLVGLDHLVLDFVCALFLTSLLGGATEFVSLFSIDADLSNFLLRRFAHLLQSAL